MSVGEDLGLCVGTSNGQHTVRETPVARFRRTVATYFIGLHTVSPNFACISAPTET